MLTLYSSSLSANGRKVLAASVHLKLKPQVKNINVYRGDGQKAEYLAINPTGKIPALVDDTFTLTESNAILQYISEVYANFELYSQDSMERATISSWLFWESSQWQPVLTRLLSEFVGNKLLPELIPAPSAAPQWEIKELESLLVQLEEHLKYQAYIACNRLTIADFSVAGMMTYFKAARFPFSSYPAIKTWYGQIEKLPAWKETAVDPWR